MKSIQIIKQAPAEELEKRGVFSWPIWEKEISVFPWTYDAREICYFLEGEVIVTPDGGKPVKTGKGDIAVFPENMSCTWKILKPVKKHYKFE